MYARQPLESTAWRSTVEWTRLRSRRVCHEEREREREGFNFERSVWCLRRYYIRPLTLMLHPVVLMLTVNSTKRLGRAVALPACWLPCRLPVKMPSLPKRSHSGIGKVKTAPSLFINDTFSFNNSACKGWLGSRVVSVLDSGAEGPGSNRSCDAVG